VLVAATVSGGTTGDGAWYLLPVGRAGLTVTARPPADFSRSLADLALDGVAAERGEWLPGVTTSQVRDTAASLVAVEAAAVANWCVRTASEYAAIRQQFGRPIGAFQAIKHLCASMACRAEAAAVLAWDAARAIEDDPSDLSLAAAAAAGFCLDAAVDVAKDCIQVLGGIGFTWEHDAHLYLRRAVALRQLLGGSSVWRDRTAVLAAAGARRALTLDGGSDDDSELATVRAAARAAATRIALLPASAQRAALAESGYAAPSWPPPYGAAATPAGSLVIDEELARAGLARPDLVIGGWAMAAIFGHGSAGQQERFAGPTLHGEITWCQLFSEPEAGSDLASLRTRADRADGGWVLTGQKVWTSLAREAGWAICLARTDASAPKHKGLTFFLVAMDTPGIDIRPLREITGRQMFNQVFLDQVFVPDEFVVGEPGAGWRVARTTLASERVAMGTGSSVGDAAERLLELAAAAGAMADPVIRQRLGALVAEGMAVSLLDLQAVMATRTGADSNSLAAVRKLVGVGHRQAAAETALELTGTADALAVQDFLLTRCLSIAGGTTQILLSLVGERLLGLPREEPR
jgi:alkylation response protein AidB-like acyl-CoA dehydrogenase